MTNDYLVHHGILGQKWGVRRWQNEDGSLTAAGRAHYGYGGEKYFTKQKFKDAKNEYENARAKTRLVLKSESKKSFNDQSDKRMDDVLNKERSARERYNQAKKDYRNDKVTNKAEQKMWKEQRRDYIRTKTVGERLATGLLLGPAGLYNYNSLMAAGEKSKVVAFGKSAAVAYTTGNIGSIAYSSLVANKQKSKY